MIGEFEKPMTYGGYLKNMVPSVLTMIFLSFYTAIDGFFVARYTGSDALAGINIVIPLTCIIFGTSVMMATGSGAIISAKMGQGKSREADEIFTFTAFILAMLALFFTAGGIIFVDEISTFLGASERLMPHVIPYAVVTFITALPMSFKLFFEYLVRNDGNPKIGLIMSFLGVVLNIVLDYWFVAVLDMGTLGAGIGTGISISVSTVVGLIYFLRHSTIRFTRLRMMWGVLLKSCTNGVSEMLTEFSTGITTFLFNIIIMRYFAEAGVAAVTIIMNIYYFFIAFYMGVTVATAPIVSYNLGAGNYRRIRDVLRYSFVTLAGSSVIILAISYICGPWIIRLFVEGGEVFDITWDGMKIFSILFAFIGVNVFMSGYFTAVGNGLASAVISSLRSLILVVILILILPPLIGVNGVWLTMPCSELTAAFVSVFLYRKYGMVDRLAWIDHRGKSVQSKSDTKTLKNDIIKC